MGSQIMGCCSEREEQESLMISSKLAKRNANIVDDYNNFKDSQWFRFQKKLLFDPNKFIFLYPNYSDEQSTLTLKWKYFDVKTINIPKISIQDKVLSSQWKFAIRKGVPIQNYRNIIGLIFNRKFQQSSLQKDEKDKKDYQLLSKQIDGKKIKKGPFFGSEGLINEFAHVEFLNKDGVIALSNILWILQKKRNSLVYNKYITHIGALLLIFLQQYQAYYILSILLQNSINILPKRLQSLRWHFTSTYNQMERFSQQFFNLAASKCQNIQKLVDHCKKFRIPLTQIFRQVIENFFYGFFRFPVILKIMLIFLNQGVKIFYRIFYGMLTLSSQLLIKLQDKHKIIQTIRNKCIMLDPQQINYLLKISFIADLKSVVMNIRGSDEEGEQNSYNYYTPQVIGNSEIISFDDLNTIWEYLPYYLKSYDVQRVFIKNEMSTLHDMVLSIEFGGSGIIIIETQSNAVFGVYLRQWIKKNSDLQFYGSSQSFVFSLQPQKHKYKSTGQNISFLNYDQKLLQIGSHNEGPALQISFNLQIGYSHRSATYFNQPLHSSQSAQFKIYRLQVFSFC